jgi:4-amino-4-deoxy-L-arabinose transferase-like glycosyltransferase
MSSLIGLLRRRVTTHRWPPARVYLAETTALMLGLALLSRAFTYNVAGLDWDESLYIVIAQRWLHGELPYTGVWDQHPMGLPAIFAVAIWFIGNGLLAARIACLLAVTATAILLTRFLTRTRNEMLAGSLAGVFYILYMARPDGLAANTEMFNNLLVAAASLLLWSELSRRPPRLRTGIMFAAGLLFGIGLQIKYVVFPEAVLLCCTALWLAWRNGAGLARITLLAGVAMAGGLLPTGVATLYFWQAGALQSYLDASLRANVAYLEAPLTIGYMLARLRFGLLPLIALLPWPFVLAWRLRDSTIRRRYGGLALWLAVWLVATMLDVASPLKFWKHYFNAMIPPLCAMAGLSVMRLAERVRAAHGLRVPALALAVLAPAFLLMIKHAADSRSLGRLDIPRAIAQQIRRGGSDGRDIYLFNYDPLVYAYAGAVPPTRYVLGIELANFHTSSGAQSSREIDRILARPPRWIVVADPSPYHFAPPIRQMLDAALQRYKVVAQYREADYIQPPITVRLYQIRASDPETG